MLCEASLSLELLSFHDVPDLPEPKEIGQSFLSNALIKADSAFAHTGIPALADDSGLVVPALQHAPGIHSARYAGVDGPLRDQANRNKLIHAIQLIPVPERQAFFHCSLVLRWNEQQFEHFVGQCHGNIVTTERGEHGFGYDPIFFLPSHQRTLAELPAVEKNRVSHRFHAIQALIRWLLAFHSPYAG